MLPFGQIPALSRAGGALGLMGGDPGGTTARPRRAAPDGPQSYRYALSASMDIVCGSDACRAELAQSPFDGLSFAVEGVHAGPDRDRIRCHGRFGPETMDSEVVRIGAVTWVRDGAGAPFVQKSPDGCAPDVIPADIIAAISGEDLKQLERLPGTERVNGVTAVHYRMSQDLMQQLAGGMGTTDPSGRRRRWASTSSSTPGWRRTAAGWCASTWN
ncbi:MAG: hypothetical protein U0531_13225 [Dehalococcoidia bacterium]